VHCRNVQNTGFFERSAWRNIATFQSDFGYDPASEASVSSDKTRGNASCNQ
jgi:hypothetical protein